MLIHGSDKERAFDIAVQRSFPYLIFPPVHDSYEGLDYDEFRNKLINNLVALNTYKNNNDDVTFYKQNEEIRNMLESSVFDKITTAEIASYKYQQMTVDKAIRDLAKKQSGLEERVMMIEHVNKKLKNRSTNINASPQKLENNMTHLGHKDKNEDVLVGIDAVYNFIRLSPGIDHPAVKIAEKLDLTVVQVNAAFSNILKRPNIHGDKIKHIVKSKIDYKPNPSLRSYPHPTYKWVETLHQNEENEVQ